MICLESKDSLVSNVCFFCKEKKTKRTCPFQVDEAGENVHICNICSKKEYISFTDVKKTYIGIDYSSDCIKYINVWISTYKIDAKYFFKKDLDRLYNQFESK